MTVRELHWHLTELIADGRGDCECVIGNTLGGRAIETVEVRTAFAVSDKWVYQSSLCAPGCVSRVVRIAR